MEFFFETLEIKFVELNMLVLTIAIFPCLSQQQSAIKEMKEKINEKSKNSDAYGTLKLTSNFQSFCKKFFKKIRR